MSRRKVMIGALIVAGVGLAIGLVIAGSEFLAIDDCLDAGGRWDYESDTCVGARS